MAVVALLLLWSGTAAQLGSGPRDAGDEVRGALQSGAYADAEQRATDWCTRVEAERGPESLEWARAADLLVEALLENGKARASATSTLAARVVQVKERQLGRDHLELATSLNNLGTLHTQRGEFGAAVPLHERALSLSRRALAPDSTEVADSLDGVALALTQLGKFPEARERLVESLRIRETRSSERPLALARTLQLAGQMDREEGRYPDAAALLDRALTVWDRTAPNHPDKADAIRIRGDVHFLMGEVAAARRTWTEALTLVEHTLGLEHPRAAIFLRSLGHAEFGLGNLAEARRLRERALRIGEPSLPPCDPEVANLLNDVAISLRNDGDYRAAQSLYRREVTLIQRCLGSTHVNLATAIHNQFNLAFEMGAIADAETLGNRAVRIWSARLGPNHPFVAFGLSELAGFVASRGAHVKARRLFERALRIRRNALGSRHPDVAWTLTDLADTIAAAGDVGQALKYLHEAIDILEKAPARDPDAIAYALVLRGTLQRRQGDLTAARASFSDALAAREEIYGPTHPRSAEARVDLAATDFALTSYDSSLALALSAEEAGRDLLRFTIRYLPERRAMAYTAKRPRGLDLALSLVAANHVPEPSAVLDALIQSRGVVLDELAARAQSGTVPDPQLAVLTQSLSAARQRFANLMLRSIEGQAVDRATLDDARLKKEEAEEALAERSAALRTELGRARAGWQEVRRALPPESALVSFVRFDRTTSTTTNSRTRSRTTPSYLAFVSRSDSSRIETVPLGSAASLDSAIATWRGEAGGRAIAAGVPAAQAERTYRVAGVRLRRRIWDPLAAHVRGAARVFIVPDGALNLVSLAALPTGANTYLVEDEPVMHYLSTERDLMPAEGAPAGRGLLAVGGPTYDRQVSGPVRASVRRSGCGSLGPLRFEDLPGSRAEAQDIARIWSPTPRVAGGEASGADGVTVLSGSAASKSAVTNASAGRRVVHLATHGFFLGSPCESAPARTRGVGGLTAPSPGAPGVADNPLLMAGLAFAGANTRASVRPGADDGILTAEDVAALNLQGTEWAVLSACDTGLGEIKAGEGVLGLRRAFQIAGARTIIMSLWSVEDQSTRSWMRSLYEGRFQRHLSTSAAVRAASLRELQSRRTRGRSTHPFYWAAFVAAGDWR